MPLDKEVAQDIIDDFVLSNEVEFETIEAENPALFDATLNALNFLSSRFGTGQKMQIVEKPKVVQEVAQGGLPFKNGDKFKVPEEKSEQTYTLSDIDLANKQVKVSWFSLRDKADKSYLDNIEEVSKRINEGNWVLIPLFEVGQILYDINEESLFKIRDITSNGIDLINANGQIQFKATGVLEKKIGGKEYILLNFKIDDVFTNKEGDIYTIYQLSKTNKLDVDLKLFHNGIMDVVSKNWETIDANIYDGVWTPLLTKTLMPKTTQLTNNPNNIKIGDLLFYSHIYKITEVLDVNQGVVKLMTSNNYKETLKLGVLNKKIDQGDMRKLPFSISDTFVAPNGDFFKIMELYPNNEKSVWVKVNDKPDLEVFEWDLIEDWVNDAYLMPGTKADAEIIKANLSDAKPNATQAKMAQVTATPTKTPKKRMTKLEKEIKDLQDEIDGLLFLADEDAEAKAELEKKQIQIEALKSKKP